MCVEYLTSVYWYLIVIQDVTDHLPSSNVHNIEQHETTSIRRKLMKQQILDQPDLKLNLNPNPLNEAVIYYNGELLP